MHVYFIGGPRHGESCDMVTPHEIIRVVEAAPYRYSVDEEPPSMFGPSFTEHTYRVTKLATRYAIAEWEPPPVDVAFKIAFVVDPYDRETTETINRFFWDFRGSAGGRPDDVKCVAATHDGGRGKFEVALQVRVDGPNDPTALALAAEKVTNYLNANVPDKAVRRIEQTSANVIS